MEGHSKKHFILVHGVCHGAWCWYKLATMLRSAGHRVTAVDLAASGVHPKQLDELRSFADYSQPLMEAMASLPPSERVVLVGHSLGGVNLALAMERFPYKIAVAVFVTAIMPTADRPRSSSLGPDQFSTRCPPENWMDTIFSQSPDGRTTITFGPNFLSTMLYQLCLHEVSQQFMPCPNTLRSIISSFLTTGFGSWGVQDLTLATMLVRQGSFFADDRSMDSMFTGKNYGSVSRVLIVCKEDRRLTADFQHWMAERSPGAEVREIELADHIWSCCRSLRSCAVICWRLLRNISEMRAGRCFCAFKMKV